MLLPVVMMGPPEVWQRFFHSHLCSRQYWSASVMDLSSMTKQMLNTTQSNCWAEHRVWAAAKVRRALGNTPSSPVLSFLQVWLIFWPVSRLCHSYKNDSLTYSFELGKINRLSGIKEMLFPLSFSLGISNQWFVSQNMRELVNHIRCTEETNHRKTIFCY